ncbi:MAG TPA: methyltransferase domain-containing protein [Leptolyngbyaceae cyanobacterium]
MVVELPTQAKLAVTQSLPVTHPELLERVALFSSRKLVLARGILTLPCDLTFIDAAVELLHAVMTSLWQQPPQTVLAEWRSLIEEKMIEGTLGDPTRLLISYHPLEDALGVTGGFQIRIATETPETTLPISRQSSLAEQTSVWGELKLPALPSLLDCHVAQIGQVLEGLGQTLEVAEVEGWRSAIAPTLDQLFKASPNAYLVVRYETLDRELGLLGGIKLHISGEIASIADEYHVWTKTRQGPLFGSHADAKVLDVATQLSNPAQSPILDIGAGTGRNSLALAQRGFPVDAVELAPALAQQLIQAKTEAGLKLSVIQGDILDPTLALQKNHYRLIFLSEVIASHFRSVEEVRKVCDRICSLLQPGGFLLFNAFLAVEGYQPSLIQQELAQAFWCCILTQAELRTAMADLPLTLLTEESAMVYEEANLPSEAWPPTDWFTGWATGRNLFPTLEQPPLELRWVLFRKPFT